MCCCTRWVAVLCQGFGTVVRSDFYLALVLSWAALASVDGTFASAMMASTGVMRSWPVIARPA